MAGLLLARLAIGFVALPRWRGRIGLAGQPDPAKQTEAQKLAAHVRRAAARLPVAGKCLPQALALGWMLRRRGVPHRLVLAARPAKAREGRDDLHAWIECGDIVVLGQLPGEWIALESFP